MSPRTLSTLGKTTRKERMAKILQFTIGTLEKVEGKSSLENMMLVQSIRDLGIVRRYIDASEIRPKARKR